MDASASGELGHLTNLLGAFVTSVGDDLREALEDEVGGGGALPAALLALDTWPDSSIDFLRRVLGLTHSGTVRLVDRLEDDGLVVRRPGVDGRTVALGLTGPGRATMRRARRARRRILDGIVGELDRHEQRALGAALDRVLRRAPRSRREARHACRICDHTVCRGENCPIGSSVDAG